METWKSSAFFRTRSPDESLSLARDGKGYHLPAVISVAQALSMIIGGIFTGGRYLSPPRPVVSLWSAERPLWGAIKRIAKSRDPLTKRGFPAVAARFTALLRIKANFSAGPVL